MYVCFVCIYVNILYVWMYVYVSMYSSTVHIPSVKQSDNIYFKFVKPLGSLGTVYLYNINRYLLTLIVQSKKNYSYDGS